MVAVNRLFVVAALASLGLVLSACPTPVVKPADAGGPPSEDCFEDTDCPDSTLFYCNTTTSKCEPACRTTEQCTAAVRGTYALDYCASGLGCQCDEGKCVGSLCAADSDCGTQVCRNGACVDAPAATTVTSCQVTPDFAIVREGSKAKFWVSGWDAAKNPVVVKTGITWSAETASNMTGSGSAAAAEFTAGAPTASAVNGPKAVIGGATCYAKVLVLAKTVPSGKLDVLVTDELSGRPIADATVVISHKSTGAVLATGTSAAATGFAELTLANDVVTVSVFHADYNYLTVANYDMATTSADARFLSFVLRRNQVDKYGGYKGTFSGIPVSANVHAGIAGMSIPGSIVDLSLSQLLGPSKDTKVTIGSAIDQTVPLPAGVYLGFNDTQIKTTVSAQGLAGVCTNADGSPNDAAINAGTCGIRTSWALAGDVSLGELPIDAFASGVNNIDFGKVLSRIIPIFKKFNSSIVRDVQFTLKATPGAAAGTPDFSDTAEFSQSNHVFNQIPLAFNFAAKVPDLPQFKGSYVDGLFLLGGALVPGRGVVPLGIGVAVNTAPADAKTDAQSEMAPGLVAVRMAPTHHGIEGADYGIVALGLSLKSATDSSAGLATSALFARVPQNKITFDPKGATPVDLGASFLGFPEGAKYNYTDTAQAALGARTFRFAADPKLTSAAVVRVVFTDRLEHRWVVYFDPSQAATGSFTLPKAPGTFTDRTLWNGLTAATDTRAPILVQALRLNDNPAIGAGGVALTYSKLVEFNSTNADRMVDFTTAFSFVDYGRPEISWSTPGANGTTVAAGSATKVKVKNFKVGTTATDDGYVKISVVGGTGTCGDMDGKTDVSAGKGEITINLPAGCTAPGGATVTATLYDNNNAALSPAVAAQLTGIIIN